MSIVRRFFKLALLFFAASTAFLLILSYIVRKYFEEDVTHVIVSELNKSLNAKVDVKDINFSLLSTFPRASLNFRNVVIYSASDFDQSQFPDSNKALVSRSVSLRFNLIDLYNRNYDIKSIVLEDTHLWLLQDDNGNLNYKIWKSSDDTSSTSLSISLEYILADNIFWRYGQKDIDVIGFVDEIDFGGQYISGDLSAQCFLTGNVQSVTTAKARYVQRIPLIFSTNFSTEGNVIRLTNASLKSRNIDFAFECLINNGKQLSYSVDIHEVNTDVYALQWFMPDSIQQAIQPYQLNGDLKFSGSINNVNQITSAQLDVYSHSFTAQYSGQKYRTNGLLNISVSNFNRLNEVSVASEMLKINIDDENWVQTKASYSWRPSKKPLLNWDADFSINESCLKPYLDTSLHISGSVSGRSLGWYEVGSEFDMTQFKNITVTADVFNAKARYNSVSVENLNGNFKLKNGNVSIPKMFCLLESNSLEASFSAKNVFEFVDPKGETINIDASIQVDSIDYHTIDLLFKEDNSSVTEKTEPPKIRLKAYIEAETFIFENHLFEKLKVRSDITPDSVVIQSSSAQMSFGNVIVWGKYQFSDRILHFQSQVQNVDMSRFLFEFDDFNQNYLTSKNIYGKLNGRLVGEISFDTQGNLQRERINLQSEFVIDNGRLEHFAPLMEMSKYLKEEDLATISFDRISNVLSIKNDSLFLPRMDVSSTLADFVVSGRQSLDNEFDYRVQILLNKVLSARRKKRGSSEQFGEIKDDGYGRTQLPLRIIGNPEQFNVYYDRIAMKESVSKRWKAQTSELKNVLKAEFKSKDSDKTNSKDSAKAIPTNFEFDWDE